MPSTMLCYSKTILPRGLSLLILDFLASRVMTTCTSITYKLPTVCLSLTQNSQNSVRKYYNFQKDLNNQFTKQDIQKALSIGGIGRYSVLAVIRKMYIKIVVIQHYIPTRINQFKRINMSTRLVRLCVKDI